MWKEKLTIKKSNDLQGLYPGTKFVIVCLYVLSTFILSTITVGGYPLYLIPWTVCIPIICFSSKIGQKFVKAYKKIMFVAVVIFLAQSLLISGGDLIWEFGVLKVYQVGLEKAISLSFLIMNIAGIFIWMFQSTENKEISRALEEAGVHYKVTYIFLSTMQMAEVLKKSSTTIMKAQQARGVETEGNLLVRSKAFFPSMVPLIIGAITSSEERVLTLEAKGFDVSGKKTHLFEVKKTGKEGLAKAIAFFITGLIIAWRIMLWVQ